MFRRYFQEFGSVIKNFSYTLSYQILSLLLPIITVPYVTRVFTQETVGLNTVVQANCSYFILVGMLGITLLGPREIAKCLGDREKQSNTFSAIFFIQFISHCIAVVGYLAYCSLSREGVITYFYLLHLFSSMFDISWFFIGIEDFKNVSIRNVLIKLISFGLLFLLIKSDSDVYIYVLTLYVPQIVINIYMWFILSKKRIKFRLNSHGKRYFLHEAISLFLPQVASSIYTILDKTILGIFTTYSLAAVYSQGQTLLKLFLAVVPSFTKVMAPRIASYIQKNDENEINKYMKMSSNVISFLSFLLMFGVFACAPIFVGWYLPEGYSQTSDVLRICAPIIIMISGANLISVEYLIPKGEQKIYTISVFVATILNLALNLTLVPFWGLYGVCIGSIVAETTGFLIQLNYVRRYLNLKKLFARVPVYFIAGIIMCVVLCYISRMLQPNFISVVIMASLGGVIYSVLVLIIERTATILKKLGRSKTG